MTEEIAEWRRDAHTAGAGLFGAAQQPTLRLDDELRSSLASKYDIGWSIREAPFAVSQSNVVAWPFVATPYRAYAV